tara:strand:- start:664 stop:1497 length:834 start_codon:yes stop_codon:yes gene_type:complete
MKPILAVCPGYPKSGTTSLFYSLCDPKYGDYPLFKEPQYWRRILRGNENQIRFDNETGEKYEQCWGWENYGWETYDRYLSHLLLRIKNYSRNPKPWLSVDDYTDLINRCECKMPNWEDYRLLYKSTSHSIPVMDFSLMNGVLTSEELDIVKSELDEHFDVRIIICLRDATTWITSCKKNFIGTPDNKECNNYRNFVKKFSSKWPTMIAKVDDFDNKDGVLSTTLNEFLGINIPKSWKVGRFNVTSSSVDLVDGYGDNWTLPDKENRHYYETVKTGIV